jgi:hypothetical protein
VKKPKSKKRELSEAGRWPVADPEPKAIDLLRRMHHWDNRAVMNDAARDQLRTEIATILSAWSEHEDVNELRELLGVKRSKNRRTQKTVNRELEIALAFVARRNSGIADPIGAVEHDLKVDVRKIERALEGWEHLAIKILGDKT